MKQIPLFLLIFFIILVKNISVAQDPAHWQLTDEDGLPSMTVYQINQDSDGYMWFGTSNGICRFDGKEFYNYSHRSMNDNEVIYLGIDKYNHIWFRNLSNQIYLINQGKVIPISDLSAIDSNEKIIDIGIIDDFIYLFTNDKDVSKKIQITRYKIDATGNLNEKYIFPTKVLFKKALSLHDDYLLFTGKENRQASIKHFIIKNDNNNLTSINPIKKDDIRSILFNLYPINKDLYFQYKTNGRIIWKIEKGLLKRELELSQNNHISGLYKTADRNFILTTKGIIIGNNKSPLDEESMHFKGTNCNIFFSDNEENFWVGTTGQGILFIPSIEMNTYNSQNSSLGEDQVFSLFWNEKNNDLYVGQNGAKISVINSHSFTNYNLNSAGRVLDIVQDQNNNFYLAIDSKSLLLKNLNTSSNEYSIINEFYSGIKTFFFDSQDNLFIGSSQKVWTFKNNKIFNSIKLDETELSKNILKKRTYCFGEDFQKRVWIGTTEGIFIYHNNEVFPLSDQEEDAYNISSIIQSKDSIMWITTLGDGVIGYKNNQEFIRYNIGNGLTSNNCKKLIIDKNNLWIATDKGVNILNRTTKKIALINKTDGLPSNEITDITFAEDQVWIGTPKGLVNFPKDLNHQNNLAPPIYISSFKIWEKDTTLSKTYNLKHHQNNFQIDFVGLGFRSKGNISYQYKLSGVDVNWVTTNSRIVRYPNVNPGEYTFEVLAINEDGIKSKTPASIKISIATPWWMTWWFWIAMALLSIGMISAFFYWRTKRIQEKQRLEQKFAKKVNALEQKALQLQMNPHFIYNTLNAIQYFLTINDTKFAMLYLSRFAKMIRMIFEQSKKNSITVEEEIDFLKLYLNLEQLRFKDQVEVEINLEDQIKLNAAELKIPPLLLQPLIENAFKHGLFQKEGKGLIKVDFKLDNTFLFCSIEDDGVGREKAKEKDNWKPKDYVSSGIKTTQERLKILNALSKKNEYSEIEIIDLYDNEKIACGTKVNVKIRYENS